MPLPFPKDYLPALEAIERELDRTFFPKTEYLQQAIESLREIDRRLNDNSLRKLTLDHIEKEKNMVRTLMWRCKSSIIKNDITQISEEAELLAYNTKHLSIENLAKSAKSLISRIDELANNNKLSYLNSKFIRFARLLVEKAMKGEYIGKNSNISRIKDYVIQPFNKSSFFVAEALYELAYLLYTKSFESFENKLSYFSKDIISDINHHVSLCGGDYYQDEEKRMKAISGIIGCAHTLIDYYTHDTPYPTKEELYEIFNEIENLES